MDRPLAVLIALFAVCSCSKPVARRQLSESDFVGVWNGHMTYSQKWIDEVRVANPEGDYDLLVKNAKRREQRLLHTIELREDRTFVGPPRMGGPMYESVTWSLSDDRTEILVTTTFPPGSVPSGGPSFTVRAYRIADQGQTLIGIDRNGNLPEKHGLMYHLTGSDADSKAFPKTAPPTEWESPDGLTVDDYLGTWVGHHTMTRDHWESIRGTKSLEDTNRAKTDFERDATLVLKSDMTFDFQTPIASSKGKWHMEGSEAVLDHDDRSAPGYQSTRPSPTSMPVPLVLQSDGTLIVRLRKYGSTGAMKMNKG